MSAVIRTPDHEFEFRDWRIDTIGDQVSMTMIAPDGTSLLINDRRTAEFLVDASAHYLRALDQAEEYARYREASRAVIASFFEPSDDEYALRNMVG